MHATLDMSLSVKDWGCFRTRYWE